MKNLKARYLYFAAFLSLSIITRGQNTQCDKCDVRHIKTVDKHFNSLNYKIVDQFLCSLDNKCDMNPKYCVLANKTLYAIAQKRPDLLVICLTINTSLNKRYIYEHIKNPAGDYKLEDIKKGFETLRDTSNASKQIIFNIKLAQRKKR